MNPVNGRIFDIVGPEINGKPRVGAVAYFLCKFDRLSLDYNLTCQQDRTWKLGRACSGNKSLSFVKILTIEELRRVAQSVKKMPHIG